METDMRDLIQRIQRLTKKEKVHILNILQTNDIKFTLNSNGYFFNLNDLHNDTIRKMEQCLELIEKNRDLITQMDRRREELLTYYSGLIEEKLQLSNEMKYKEYTNKILLKSSPYNISMKKEQKYKGRMHLQRDRDPDDLIKEYNSEGKSNLKKGTAMYRLSIILKSTRGRVGKGFVCDWSYEEDEAEGGMDEVEFGYDHEVEAEDELGVEPEAEDDNEVDVEPDEVEEEIEEEVEPDEVESDDGTGEIEGDAFTHQTEIVPYANTVDRQLRFDRQYDHFKEILTKKGYKFSSNDLVFQDYIA